MPVAPSFSDVYLAPRVRNGVLPISNNEVRKIFSGDLSYIIRYPKFNARITAFNTNFQNDTKVIYYFGDRPGNVGETFVNYFITGINKVHQGIELGVEVKVLPVLAIVAGGSIGNYRYTNRPSSYMTSESGLIPDSTQKIYCKNFFVSGSPQTAGSIGLKFGPMKNWYANLNANIFANNWVDFAPNQRTLEFFQQAGIYPGDERLTQITEQKLANNNPQFTLDASVSKTFKIKNLYLGINLSCSNVLNNTKMITSGYEQARSDVYSYGVNGFPPKYYYGYGRTYFLMASLRL